MVTISSRVRTRLQGRSFLAGVLTLASGNALGQAIVVLASPLLTRLYTPADFGVLSVFSSMLTMLVLIAALRYEQAIPLPEDDETAANTLALSLSLVAIVSVLAALAAQLFGGAILRLTHTPGLRPYLWALPIGCAGGGAYLSFNFWAVRKRAYGRIAVTKLNQNIGLTATQLVLGLLKVGPIGLIAGFILGQAGGTGTLATMAWRDDRQSIRRVTLAGMGRAARRYRQFPLVSSISALLSSSGFYIPSLLLAASYGTKVAGWFALGQRVIGVPVVLVGQGIAQVYTGEAARLAAQDPVALHRLFLRCVKRLAIPGALIGAALFVASPLLFTFVFGPAWREAGVYLQILALTFVVVFVSWPLTPTLNLIEQQGYQLAWDICRSILVVGAMLFCIKHGVEARWTILVYAVTMLAGYAAHLFLSHKLLLRHIEKAAQRRDTSSSCE